MSLDFKDSLQFFGRCSWAKQLISRTSAKDLETSLEIQAQILGGIPIPSVEFFRYAAGHLKFRYQSQCSNLLMYFDNINFLLPRQLKDPI